MRGTGASELRKGAPHIREQGHDVDGAGHAETGNHAAQTALNQDGVNEDGANEDGAHANGWATQECDRAQI